MSRFSRTTEKTKRARELRRVMTPAEWNLWALMRSAKFGVSFRRQHPIGPYFADFYCATLKLVVELDGSQHGERVTADEVRTAVLRERGIEVIRFWNWEVMENVDAVSEQILWAVRRRQFEFANIAVDPLPASPFQGEE